MSFIGKLFQKEPDLPSLKAQVNAAGGDPVKLSKACYRLGVWYMDHSDPDRAMLWLGRADTIYSAQDETYEAVGETLADDCSSRIGRLEEADSLVNEITREVETLAEDLSGSVVTLWGLMSVARLVKLGQRLGTLPGCQSLGRLYRAVDLVAQSFQGPLNREEFDQLRKICNQLCELADAPAFWAGGELSLPAGAPFQVFDLNGLQTLLSINLYLDSHLQTIAEGAGGAETGVIACSLLADYYLRTREGNLRDMPAIQAEVQRIRDDCAFLRDHPPIQDVLQRVRSYQSLELPV